MLCLGGVAAVMQRFSSGGGEATRLGARVRPKWCGPILSSHASCNPTGAAGEGAGQPGAAVGIWFAEQPCAGPRQKAGCRAGTKGAGAAGPPLANAGATGG